MLNENFARMEMLYRAIDEINDIMNNDEVKNYECKLDAVLSAVSDIKKTEFDDKIADAIIANIKEGVEDIYRKDMQRMHKNIGLNMSFEHCNVEKDSRYLDDPDDKVIPAMSQSVKTINPEIKINTSVEDPLDDDPFTEKKALHRAPTSNTPEFPSFLKGKK